MSRRFHPVRGTIFNEFHDEDKIIKSIDFREFEEQFKLGNRKPTTGGGRGASGRNHEGSHESDLNNSLGGGGGQDGGDPNSTASGTDGSRSSSSGASAVHQKRFKQPEKVSFMEHNRLRNMAISLRKLATPIDLLVAAVNRLDIEQLSLDSIEILMRMIPTAQEQQAYQEYEAQGKLVEALTDEDRFLCQMSKIDRLDQKVKTMFFMKNLDVPAAGGQGASSLSSAHSLSSSTTDSADLLGSTRAKIEFIETAARSLRTSDGVRTLLEYILVFGNYLNSSSRSLASAPAYGFKLQALDMVTEARSTQDKARNLLHFIVATMLKNLDARERAMMTTRAPAGTPTLDGETTTGSNHPTSRTHAVVKRVSPLAVLDQESIRMPYEFDQLMVELEQAAQVSLETLLIEVKELERGMDLCIKELHLRCAAAEALEQQRQQQQQQQQQQSNQHRESSSPSGGGLVNFSESIKNPTDESISRLQKFIKSRTSEIVEIRELVQRAQREFNECAQYFGENPRTIESSSLFSIFLRHLKAFRQCQIDNKMIEKRKFDEELRRQIQQQQALRAQKKRLASQQEEEAAAGQQRVDATNNNNNNNNGASSAGGPQPGSKRNSAVDPESGRLLHQDEVSHGTLDILITGLKVEPYRRVDGVRKSMRRLERQSSGTGNSFE